MKQVGRNSDVTFAQTVHLCIDFGSCYPDNVLVSVDRGGYTILDAEFQTRLDMCNAAAYHD